MALLGLLLLLLALVLFCKFRYKIFVKKDGPKTEMEYNVKFIWLFGILRYKLSDKKEKKERKQKESRSEEKEKEKKPLSRLKGFDVSSSMQIVKHSVDLLKKILKVIRPKKVRFYGRYGAESPDKTGMVLAAASMLVPLLTTSARIEGDFEKEDLQLDIYVMGSFRLWAIALSAVKYIFKPEIWGLLFPKKGKKAGKRKKLRSDYYGN